MGWLADERESFRGRIIQTPVLHDELRVVQPHLLHLPHARADPPIITFTFVVKNHIAMLPFWACSGIESVEISKLRQDRRQSLAQQAGRTSGGMESLDFAEKRDTNDYSQHVS